MADCYEGFVTEVVLYKDRDNAVTVIPYSDLPNRVNYDMTAVTRVVANADLITSLAVGDSIVGDSDVTQAVFWNDDTIINGVAQWRIYCKVGLFTGIVAGEYTLRITVFDPDHPNGLVLPGSDEFLHIIIKDLP